MMKWKSLVLFSAAAVAVSGCGSNETNSSGNDETTETKTMRFSTTAAEDQPITQGAYRFAEIVEEETNGSITVEIFTDGQLGGDIETIDALRSGTVEASNLSTGPIATVSPSFAVFDLPFLFDSEETAYDVLDSDTGTKVLEELPEAGMIGLGYWENGFRYLTNNEREVTSVEDVEGLQIRTIENDLHMDAWSELGANPTPMSFTELFTALEQGVVDGQEGTYPNMRYNSFQEVQEYFTDTGHIYSPSVMLISKSFWDELNTEEQDILQMASDEARDYQRELSQEDNAESHEVMAEEMTMTELTDEARQEFVEATQPIYEQYRSEIGEELMDEVMEAAQN